MSIIRGFFTNAEGQGSSKRIMGIALLTAGIVYVFVRVSPDVAILTSLFVAGTALLGVSAFTKT